MYAIRSYYAEAVREQLAVPAHFEIEIGIAIGRSASPDRLPPALREREVPSDRLPLASIAFAGRFPDGADGNRGAGS